MKVLEHILNIVREVSIDEMWFGLMSGKGTTNASFYSARYKINT